MLYFFLLILDGGGVGEYDFFVFESIYSYVVRRILGISDLRLLRSVGDVFEEVF